MPDEDEPSESSGAATLTKRPTSRRRAVLQRGEVGPGLADPRGSLEGHQCEPPGTWATRGEGECVLDAVMGSEGIRVGGRGVATGVRRESLGDEGERLSLTHAVEPLELDG